MELKDIISITGMSGLYKIESQRSNGVIVEGLEDGKKKFISSRQHMFTPLDNITIFTDDDGVELAIVFRTMKEKEGEIPPVDAKSDADALREYFLNIVPDYDVERVYPSDIKKVIKWYHMLNDQGLITLEKEEENSKASTDSTKKAASEEKKDDENKGER